MAEAEWAQIREMVRVALREPLRSWAAEAFVQMTRGQDWGEVAAAAKAAILGGLSDALDDIGISQKIGDLEI